MLQLPQSKPAQRYMLVRNSDLWEMGPEAIGLWILLIVNSSEYTLPVETDCFELGRYMPSKMLEGPRIGI